MVLKYWMKLVLVAVGLAAISYAVVDMRYATHWENAKIWHKSQVVSFIRTHATAAGITAEDFATTSADRHQEVFAAYFAEIQSPEILRIKVWDRNFTIIWSNLTETIGQQFADNHELEEALEGEVEIEIEAGKEEHVSERHYTEFAEIYVPILDANDPASVVGVVEVYQPSIMMRDVADAARTKDARAAGSAALVIFGISALALRPKNPSDHSEDAA